MAEGKLQLEKICSHNHKQSEGSDMESALRRKALLFRCYHGDILPGLGGGLCDLHTPICTPVTQHLAPRAPGHTLSIS